jgi:hypothetical protein
MSYEFLGCPKLKMHWMMSTFCSLKEGFGLGGGIYPNGVSV